MQRLYYEDLRIHQSYRSEGYLLTEEKIIAFSKEWDPDGIHVDPKYASGTRLGGLIAPAVLLMAIWSRLARQQQPKKAYIVGMGWDQVRFLIPARPGDIIFWEEELLSKRKSKSDPTSGIVHYAMKLLNQRDEPVVTFDGTALIERRPVR